jgi:hypothetical protein
LESVLTLDDPLNLRCTGAALQNGGGGDGGIDREHLLDVVVDGSSNHVHVNVDVVVDGCLVQ